MKCIKCKNKIKEKDAIILNKKIYCKRCYNKIPKEIVIYPIVPLTDIKDSKISM